MSFFSGKTKTNIGKIVKVTGGILSGKYGMIAKEHDEVKAFKDTTGKVVEEAREEGYSIYVDSSDWPTEVPNNFNAIFVRASNVTELTAEETSLLTIKFPNPDQFE